MARTKISHFRRRGQKVRFNKKPNAVYFKRPNPFDHNRLVNEIQHAEGQFNDKQLSRKPDMPHHKWEIEEEIIEKETKKSTLRKKKK